MLLTRSRSPLSRSLSVAANHRSTVSVSLLLVLLSDIRPTTQFAAVSIDGTCAGDNTGKSYVRLGYGTKWSMVVVPGNYCLTLIKSDNDAEDVWFTLTATRP
jgi:hypothetical protein